MDLEQLIAYYVALLIIQYNGLPNASASVALVAETILSDNIVPMIEAAYNVNAAFGATAVGPQLDVIGKYVGIDRFFLNINYGDYFAMVTYTEHSSLPSSPPAFGFDTYADYPTSLDYNGTLVYADIVTSENALSDPNFLTLILLAILRNNMNFSNEAIDTAMWNLFGATIRPEQGNFTMTMFYFFEGSETTLIQAMLAKGLLPKPMGVRLFAVTGITGDVFSMVSYDVQSSPFGYGYSTYSDYATLPGDILVYSQITEQ